MKTENNIKNKLSNLKRLDSGHFEFLCEPFLLKINTNKILEPISNNKNDRITFYDKVDVALYEKIYNIKTYKYVYVWQDNRFKNYTALKYEGCNYYYMDRMPIHNLCELIKYLYKLSNLTVFM